MSETPEATAGNTGEAEPQTGLTVSKDTLEGAVAPSVPLRPTFTDAAGVERIAGPPVSNWEPAPVEPSEEQIARMDEHNAREAERRDARLNALTDSERLGDTAQPLVDANRAYADELGSGDVTDVTPTDPSATGDPTATADPTTATDPTSVTSPDPNVGSTTGTTVPPAAPSGQAAVEADATAAADADVASQVEAARAAQAQETANTADQTLRDAEAAEVASEEGQA